MIDERTYIQFIEEKRDALIEYHRNELTEWTKYLCDLKEEDLKAILSERYSREDIEELDDHYRELYIECFKEIENDLSDDLWTLSQMRSYEVEEFIQEESRKNRSSNLGEAMLYGFINAFR